MRPIPAAIPEPLRNFLAEVRELKRCRVAAGYRHTATNAREAMEGMTRRYVTRIPPVPMIRDELVPGHEYLVPVRLYLPAPGEERPVALFAHGGGHVGGSVSVYDAIARKLALASGWAIASVEYRLAPECPYPSALKDLMACIKGIFDVLRRAEPPIPFAPRLALIGDSGGGALCASAAHLAQYDPEVTVERQVLIYPSLDYSLSQPSVTENGEGLLLERARILWYFDCYLRQAENRRTVSPLFMNLSPSYPRTLVATAQFCPLRDEGLAYVERLRGAGITCDHLGFPGQIHAFLNLEDLDPETCADLYRRIGDFLAAP